MHGRRWWGGAAFAVSLGVAGMVGPPTASRAQEATAATEEATTPVQVFVVRHAEKAADDPRDPSLSEAGGERARELARTLRHAGVTHLFATRYRRTRDTLAPLAEATGKEVVVTEAGDMAGLASRLEGLPPGSVAVVAGHSNTVPALVGALGGEARRLTPTRRGPMLGEDEYSRLFHLSLAPAEGEARAPSCVELVYGKD